MTDKRRALAAFTKAELLEIGGSLGVSVASRMTVDEIRDELGKSKRASLARILPLLSRDQLKLVCSELGLSSTGTEKQVLIERILGEPDESGEAETSKDTKDDLQPGLPLGAAGRPSPARDEADASTERPKPVFVKPAAPLALKSKEVLSSTDDSAKTADATTAVAPVAAAAQVSVPRGDKQICVEVEPRQPRLAWHGMDRKAAVLPVPTQIVEIVRPGRAVDRGDQLGKMDTRTVEARERNGLPPNRLIWTNDNLVALRTLLDEKDPDTGDYRYRGKVDLVYIDPPFMVNSDFRADNSIDIELDDEEGVQAKKEPSLVEILAYKDTWRQGLDSFLSMLRQRLVLLKELMAPTGSIYVHLDWHAVHYIKILMDELFGYENFRNEIIWQRTTAHNDPRQFGRVNDRLLFYAMNKKQYVFETVYYSSYSQEQLTRYK